MPESIEGAVGIVIVSHQNIGQALLAAVEFLLGPQDDCCAISINSLQNVTETVARLDDAANRLDNGAGVLVLTDMFGGNPTNIALSLLGKHNVEVVTGVNLPMLLKVFSERTEPLEKLAEIAKQGGAEGIVITGRMLKFKPKKKNIRVKDLQVQRTVASG